MFIVFFFASARINLTIALIKTKQNRTCAFEPNPQVRVNNCIVHSVLVIYRIFFLLRNCPKSTRNTAATHVCCVSCAIYKALCLCVCTWESNTSPSGFQTACVRSLALALPVHTTGWYKSVGCPYSCARMKFDFNRPRRHMGSMLVHFRH